MKRFGFVMIIAFLVIGTVFAQDRSARRSRAESITVDGTLQLQNGFIAVSSGDTVYYVPRLGRYVGFIDGLKEGSRVSIEGHAFRNFLQPVKVTVDGRAYNFPEGPGFAGSGWGGGPGYGSFGRNAPGRGAAPGWCCVGGGQNWRGKRL